LEQLLEPQVDQLNMKTIVVIPTYNEADNLPALTDALWALDVAGLEILVVDDNSPDGTGRVADELAARWPGKFHVIHREGKNGLGTAYVAGFTRALELGAHFVVQMDADFSHSPTYIPRFLDAIRDYDVVVGSRYVLEGKLDERWGTGRLLLSRWGNVYAKLILGVKSRDATGGFKLWRRETLQGIQLDRIRSNGYIFQVEMAYVTERLGYRVNETPIYFEDRRIGHSKMTMGVKLEAAWRTWEVWWRHRRLTPAMRFPLTPRPLHAQVRR
jgi:dolichol-phosphate mannosyltransferase